MELVNNKYHARIISNLKYPRGLVMCLLVKNKISETFKTVQQKLILIL